MKAGDLGMKTGHGFYAWRPKRMPRGSGWPITSSRPSRPGSGRRELHRQSGCPYLEQEFSRMNEVDHHRGADGADRRRRRQPGRPLHARGDRRRARGERTRRVPRSCTSTCATTTCPTVDLEVARRTVERYGRPARAIIQLSTGGLNIPYEERMQLVESRPRMATLNPCTMTFATGEFRNPPEKMPLLAQRAWSRLGSQARSGNVRHRSSRGDARATQEGFAGRAPPGRRS